MPSEPSSPIVFNPRQKKLARKIAGWGFVLYLLRNLPMGLIAGLRVVKLSPDTCITSVPFKWVNKNPFASTYFAVQSMAAELSTACNCLMAAAGSEESVAFIIVEMKALFTKKVTEKVFFICRDGSLAYDAVRDCIEKNEASTATFTTTGTTKNGTEAAQFEFTWSFKKR